MYRKHVGRALILALMLSGATSMNAQRITRQFKNVPLKTVLAEVEKELQYSIIYKKDEVNERKQITRDFKDASLEEVLSAVLDNGLSYSVQGKMIVISKKEAAGSSITQQKQIIVKGIVKDENGEPVVGANVVEKGTSNGTITDMDGNFSLSISEGSQLSITYIGYLDQNVTVGKGKTVLNIQLREDMQALEEVVVVGYGTMKKSDLTGSISTISAKDFNKGISSTPDQLLSGKIPGLMVNRSSGDPNSSATMQLRGPSSLTASTAPFYVIDGVPGASIDLVSPDDIESMNVLKDASATAIYGSRAANGVIMVTTRKGRTGKPQVHYSGYAAIESVSGRVNVFDAEEHRAFLAEHNMELAASDDGYSTDWQKELTRDLGFSHNHNLSLVGGNENTKYNASVNYQSKQGIVKKSQYEKLTARIGVDQEALNNKLHLSFSLSGSHVNTDHINYSIFNYAARWLPESPIYSDAPEYEQYGGYFQVPGRMTYYNPVALLNQQDDKRYRNTLQGIGKVGWDIIEGLRFDLLGSMQIETTDRSVYYQTTDISVIGKGYAMREFLKDRDKVLEATLNYSKTFHDKHGLKIMAGYSYQNNIMDDGIRGTNDYFTSDVTGSNNLASGNGDQSTHFQDYPLKKEATLVSFFGRINYDFNNRYLLTATLRRDGSSKFGANNKWAMFPSVSLAWRISEEKFMEEQSVFQDLKLRIGYGQSGNQNIDPYTSQRLYGPQSSQFMYNGEWINSYGVSQNPNPDLKWETTAMTNIGLDYTIWEGRVSGTLDFYNKETKDMLYKYNVPSPPYQYNQLLANGASMTNRGVEFMVNVVAVDRPDFSWTTNFNVAYNKNEIGSLDSNVDNLSISERYEGTMYLEGWTAQTVSIVKPGLPIGTFYTYKYMGYDAKQQKTLYENAAGEIVTIDKLKSPDDYQVVGSALPKVTFGWNNTFRYKRWDLNFFLRGVTGNKIFNASRADLSRLTQAAICNISHEAVEDGIMEAPQPSSRWLENGSFLKLDNVTLGYQFDTEKMPGINNLRVYITGQNLFTITKYTGIDPEVSLSGLAPGIDNRNYYPKTRSFLLGVNISF